MKSLLALMAVCACLCSCKKEYTCFCNTTYVLKNNGGTYNTFIFGGSETKYSQKLTQKQASAACNDEENSVKTSVTDIVTANGSNPLQSGESVNTSCGLK